MSKYLPNATDVCDEPKRDDLFGHGQSFGNDEPPPDVDKMWKDFNKKLNKWVPGAKKKGGGGDPEDDDPYNDREAAPRGLKIICGILFLVASVFWMGSGVYAIDEGEIGIVTTFGRFTRYTSSGISWHFPWPIQKHEIINIAQERTIEVGYRDNLRNRRLEESQMPTVDGYVSDIRYNVLYRVKDAKAWLYNNRDEDVMVRSAAESVMRERVAQMSFAQVMDAVRDGLGKKVLPDVQKVLNDYQSGIEVTDIALLEVQPPQAVQNVYEEAERVPYDVQAMKNEGQTYTEQLAVQAQHEAIEMNNQAQMEHDKIVQVAKSESEQFKQMLEQYKKDPEAVREKLYNETMTYVTANAQKIVLDSRAGQQLFTLPLDTLEKLEAAEQAKQAKAQEKAKVHYSPVLNTRSRENRMRGGRQ